MVKAMKSAKAKAKAKGIQIAPVKKKAETSKKLLALGDEEEITRASKGSRSRPSRTPEEVVKKKIRDHFPGFTEEELTSRLVSNMNVEMRITADMEAIANGKKLKMGKYYFQNLRKLYRDPESAISKLEVKDINEQVDEDLESALEQLLATRGSSAELHQWIEDVETCRSWAEQMLGF